MAKATAAKEKAEQERRQRERRAQNSDPERTLPHSLEAERAVLGAIILNNAAYERAGRYVNATRFYRDAHRRVYAALERLLDAPGGAVDLALLKEELVRTGDLDEVGGPSYLAALIDGVPRATNIDHYARIVKEKALLRDCVYLGNRIVTDAYCAEDPVDTIITQADQAIVALQHGAVSEPMRSFAQTVGELYDELEWRINHKGELTGITTGFIELNQKTFGWQAGDLIVVAARPSMGKTTFVMNSAFAGAETIRPDGSDRHVAVFSMEMRRKQWQMRTLSSLSGVDHTRLRSGYIRQEEGPTDEWPGLRSALARMEHAHVHIDDTAARTVWDVRAECRRLRSEHGLDLIVIDYVQLMPGTLERRGATRNEEITHISRSLKVLAGELSVPIVLLSQLKRTNNATPQLEDLRESGALEQDADIVFFLHRKDHRLGGPTKGIIAKQRDGETGTIMLSLSRETCLFTDALDLPAPTADEEAHDAEQAQKTKAIIKKRAHAR